MYTFSGNSTQYIYTYSIYLQGLQGHFKIQNPKQ